MILTGLGGGSPALPFNALQFNNAGAFGASAELTWTPGQLSVVGQAAVGDAPLLFSATDERATLRLNRVITALDTSIDGYFTDYPLRVIALVDLAADTPEGYVYANSTLAFVVAGNTKDFTEVAGGNFEAIHEGDGHVDFITGVYNYARASNAATSDRLVATYVSTVIDNTASVAVAASIWVHPPSINQTATVGVYYGVYVGGVDATLAPSSYHLWCDSQGVYRIREDNVADTSSFPQAVPALYNPRFTQYTPGAANFERGVQQWVGNVYQMGTQVGAGGGPGDVLRGVQIIGASLTVPGGTTLLATSSTLTNGAAAELGTLTNAPAAGNPTKWIPINDNGTTRYIPAW